MSTVQVRVQHYLFSILFTKFNYFRDDDWTSWKNVEGQTDAIRTHLKKAHGKYWREMVLLKQLKGWTKFGTSNNASESPVVEREPFSLEGFYDRLTKWIAVDDQVSCHYDFPNCYLRLLSVFTCCRLPRVTGSVAIHWCRT